MILSPIACMFPGTAHSCFHWAECIGCNCIRISVHRALFSKATASGGNRILVITVSQTSVLFQYQTASLQMEELPISGLALPPNTWHHIDVTVYKEDFAFFLNGTLRRASSLSSAVQDSEGIVFLGQVAPGKTMAYYCVH